MRDDGDLPVRTTAIRRSPSPKASYRRSEEIREERRAVSVAPTRVSRAPTKVSRAPTKVSRAPTQVSRASSRPRSTTRSHYVEVDRESSASSASSKTRRPYSEFSMHEREYRRAVVVPEYETYRYVEPREDYRRASRDGRRYDENIRISMTRDRR